MPEPSEVARIGQKQSLQFGTQARSALGLRQGMVSGSSHCLAPAQKGIKSPSLAHSASSAGSFTQLEESAKILVFPSSFLNHLCCGRSQTTPVCSEFESIPSTKDLESVLSHIEQNKN